MKRIVATIIAILMAASFMAGCNPNGPDPDNTQRPSPTKAPIEEPDSEICGLRVNYEQNPSCVEETPMFSWAFNTEKRGIVQKSYRLKVALSESKLLEDDAVWDSGTVASAENVGVKYGGGENTLKEATKYYWNVSVTCESGETYTSPVAWFETALTQTGFDDAEWITVPGGGVSISGANWIWLMNGDSQSTVPAKTEYFRKKIEISKEIASAYIAFTADDCGELYINGRQVFNVEEATDTWKSGLTEDVTGVLKKGTNVIAARVKNSSLGYAGLLVSLQIVYADGTKDKIVTDGSWLAAEKASGNWYAENADEKDYKKVNFSDRYGASPWYENVSLTSLSASAPMVRYTFKTEGTVASAKLFASAAGLYEAYVNGVKAGDSALDPGRSEYQKEIMYQCYDVTDSMVSGGDNTIGAVLGRGWYIGAYSPYGGTAPAFICKLVVDYADGTRKTFTTGSDWQYTDVGPIKANDIFDGETYDARDEAAVEGWATAGFDAGAWQKALTVKAADIGIGTLVPQVSGTVKVMDRIGAVSVTKYKKNIYIYDFGQNLAGVVELKNMKAKAGTEIVLRHAEMLNDGSSGSDGPKGSIYVANLRSAKATDRYIFKGGKEAESYTPTFTFHGFRYLEISGLSEPLPLEDVTALVLYSDMEDTGSITTSDELLNKLVLNTYWGQRGNFLSTPTDCPQRDERMGWSGDAQIFAGTAAYNMNVKAFFDKYNTDLNNCQHSDGSYPDVAPETWRANYSGSGNNAWGDAGIIIPWIMYVRYGDLSYIEKYYDNMKRYSNYLVQTSSNYIRNVSAYGDWLSIGESTDKSVTDTAYCAYDNDLLAKMATLLGKTDDAQKFADRAQKYREAWNNKFVKSDTRLRYDTQTAYAVALAFDLLPEEKRQSMANRLNDKIVRNGYKLTTGFIGCPLLLPALCRFGHTDTAFKLLQQEEYPSWKYPILQGATTIWERWNSYTLADGFGDAGMNSFNHYSYGSVTEWIYNSLIGIKTDENSPAFAHFFLNPTAGGGLTHAEGKYVSVRGTIESSWEAENDKIFKYSCTVPGNTKATLTLSAADASKITEQGKALGEVEGIKVLSEEGGVVTLELLSGSYIFEIK